MKKKPVKNVKLTVQDGVLKILWDQNDDQWGVCCFCNEKELINELTRLGVVIDDISSFCKLKEQTLTIDYTKKRCPLYEESSH